MFAAPRLIGQTMPIQLAGVSGGGNRFIPKWWPNQNKNERRSLPHQWCALFYRLLHSSTRHIEKVEGGERDTQLVHVNEATAV